MTRAPHPISAQRRPSIRGARLLVLASTAVSGCGGERVYPVRLELRLADGNPAAGCAVVVMRNEPPEVVAGGEVGPDGSCAPVVCRGGGLP